VELHLSSDVLFKHRTQPWQVAVSFFVGAYLVLGVATSSVRAYHWFMLLAIPGALLSAKRGRGFFLDWAPLFAFWLVYDRLRLVQPLLYSRVEVEHPFLIERACFGWMAKGDAPAHGAFAWLASNPGAVATSIEWAAQIVYFSHLFVVPSVIAALWMLGSTRERCRTTFVQFVRVFTILNFSAIVVYLLLPVAPPWWVTLHGMTQPTAELVRQANMSAAMHGALIQGMIRNASQLFAAVPSLHGAYPVLLLLLGWPSRSRLTRAAILSYGCAMWAATVILNQHYIIDLLAGALLAVIAWWVAKSPRLGRILKRALRR
jgi:inositol phosphorylceramide synthase catalytic subunit